MMPVSEDMFDPTGPALRLCAIFTMFDQAALRDTLLLDDSRIANLLGHADVQQASGSMVCLQAPRATELLGQLRIEQPQDEAALHERAFWHFLERLRTAPPEHAELLETACMHHLRELRSLYLDYVRRDDIPPLIDAVRAATSTLRPEHRHRLDLYDAYTAMRHQDYGRSRALLDALINHPETAIDVRAEALITRGLGAMNQAQLEAAQADFTAAANLAAQIGNGVLRSMALLNQSWIHNQLLQFETALQLSQESLTYSDAAGDVYGSAFALYSIGNNAIYLGHWQIGQKHLDEAAAIYERAGMTARLGLVEWARGFLHQVLGNESISQQAYVRTLDIATSAEYGDITTASDTLLQLGLLYQTRADYQHAADSFDQAIHLANQLRDPHRRAMTLYRCALLYQQRGDACRAMQTCADAIDSLESLRVDTHNEEMKIGLLGTTQQLYEFMVLAKLAAGDTAGAFAYVERARARALLDLLALRGSSEMLLGATADLAAVQARLAPDALLLEYFTIGTLPPGDFFVHKIPAENTRLRQQLTLPPEILLFAVTAEHLAIHRIAVNPNDLQPTPSEPSPGTQMLTDRKLRWLYNQLIAPIGPQLREYRLLHIVPHGALHYVPFAALQTPERTPLLAPDGPAIAYAPSATLLCACFDQPPSTGTASASFGYNSEGPAALHFAEPEAQLIGACEEGAVFIGRNAKREQLYALGPSLRRLHIASHAVYRPDDPLGSYLLLGNGDAVDARSLMQQLRLNTTVVTLNACTSGLSKVTSGDELLGLPRAFLYAGATTIVCALHEIDDLAASILMVQLCEHLAQGESAAVALQKAQVVLRTMPRYEAQRFAYQLAGDQGLIDEQPLDSNTPFAHPRYWAPFMVVGRP